MKTETILTLDQKPGGIYVVALITMISLVLVVAFATGTIPTTGTTTGVFVVFRPRFSFGWKCLAE